MIEPRSTLVENGGPVSRLEQLGSDALLGLLVGRRWFPAAGNDPRRASVSQVVHADDELELANRPDWVGIPVAGLERMLEAS